MEEQTHQHFPRIPVSLEEDYSFGDEGRGDEQHMSSIFTLLTNVATSILSFSLMSICFKLREGERKNVSGYHVWHWDCIRTRACDLSLYESHLTPSILIARTVRF